MSERDHKIKLLEEQLNKQRDYNDIKHELKYVLHLDRPTARALYHIHNNPIVVINQFFFCFFLSKNSMLKEEFANLRNMTEAHRNEKALEMFLLEKTKLLQNENAALKAAQATELSGK